MDKEMKDFFIKSVNQVIKTESKQKEIESIIKDLDKSIYNLDKKLKYIEDKTSDEEIYSFLFKKSIVSSTNSTNLNEECWYFDIPNNIPICI